MLIIHYTCSVVPDAEQSAKKIKNKKKSVKRAERFSKKFFTNKRTMCCMTAKRETQNTEESNACI